MADKETNFSKQPCLHAVHRQQLCSLQEDPGGLFATSHNVGGERSKLFREAAAT
jgi:hypothetical protein